MKVENLNVLLENMMYKEDVLDVKKLEKARDID